MSETVHITKISFTRFKAFVNFTLHLRHFNILVGPNNAGKSTIIAAFRILAAALRRATTRNPEVIEGPHGPEYGYNVDISAISVAEENIFYNYDDSEPALIRFKLSNGNELVLYFRAPGECLLIVEAVTSRVMSASQFKRQCNLSIGFAPILGPVDHHESLFGKDAAYNALFNYRASRNFRNIWYSFPEKFELFRSALNQTWPGMDIERPTVDTSHGKPQLNMFCLENRIPREIFWAGFGFQVWCQMLTHIIQSNKKSLFLIDEPDIYLHSDLQRQLLGILRNMGPDIIIATHSLEIITEAEADDIVLINKARRNSRRVQDLSQLGEIFKLLGSALNPILTQLAKTRRVVFVEGKDFQIISRFAKRLGVPDVANRSEFAVVPIEGFNPDRIRTLKKGMEATLGVEISAAAILDRDYRSDAEWSIIAGECREECVFVFIHDCKEIENYLLVPSAMDVAIKRRMADNVKRGGKSEEVPRKSAEILESFAAEIRSDVISKNLAFRKVFERSKGSHLDEASINKRALDEFEKRWQSASTRLQAVPGKAALSYLNAELQRCGVNITPTAIIEAMQREQVPDKMQELIKQLSGFLTGAIIE